MDIRNMPAEASNYEFIVAIPNADHYTFIGMYADGYEAEKTALEYGGIVIHNVRIQGYQKPKKIQRKYYLFSGCWSWGCWAKDEKEAHMLFNDAYYDEIDMDFDHFQMEIINNLEEDE